MSASFELLRELLNAASGAPLASGSASPPSPTTPPRVQPPALHELCTEQHNSATEDIDTLSTLDMCRLINAEDALVAAAVADITPTISEVIDRIVERVSEGGRLLYMGAGTSGR